MGVIRGWWCHVREVGREVGALHRCDIRLSWSRAVLVCEMWGHPAAAQGVGRGIGVLRRSDLCVSYSRDVLVCGIRGQAAAVCAGDSAYVSGRLYSSQMSCTSQHI